MMNRHKFFSSDHSDPTSKLLLDIGKVEQTVRTVSGNNPTPANEEAKATIEALKEQISSVMRAEKSSNTQPGASPAA